MLVKCAVRGEWAAMEYEKANVPEKNSILIIDDSELNIAVLIRILSTDYIVYTAKNGREGLELAKKYMPDMIILDVVMPDMDGYDVISILKNDERLKNTPVIFITGLTNIEEEEKGLALGGADFITKPFSSSIVKLRVKNQIRIIKYIKEIARIGMEDWLTGIPNRRSFEERLYSEWERAQRTKQTISILIIDIDFFKKCNDTYGHTNGDFVLKKIAKIIAKTLKRPGDYAARWGGEEFIALLPDTNPAGAAIIAEEIRESIEKAEIRLNDGRVVKQTVSIGVNTQTPPVGEPVDGFINHADDVLYSAKAKGRNQVCVYRETEG
jgi:diguanylate cyclase (GGDEF)-like protein